jgi:hypothetical protein
MRRWNKNQFVYAITVFLWHGRGSTELSMYFPYQAWNKMADWAYELGQRVVENAAKANNKVDLTHDEKAGEQIPWRPSIAHVSQRSHGPNNYKDTKP